MLRHPSDPPCMEQEAGCSQIVIKDSNSSSVVKINGLLVVCFASELTDLNASLEINLSQQKFETT